MPLEFVMYDAASAVHLGHAARAGRVVAGKLLAPWGCRMSRQKAIVLAIFTVWPFLYMLFFMCTIFGLMMSGFGGSSDSSGPPAILLVLFPLHFLTMLEIIVLMVFYIVDVFKTDRVPQDKKALWAVVLFLGNIIAMPVYWYLYIWKPIGPGIDSHAPRQSVPNDSGRP